MHTSVCPHQLHLDVYKPNCFQLLNYITPTSQECIYILHVCHACNWLLQLLLKTRAIGQSPLYQL